MTCGILDAYKVADQIRKAYPDENAALQDIMTVMLAGRGGMPVIEFNPRNMVINPCAGGIQTIELAPF